MEPTENELYDMLLEQLAEAGEVSSSTESGVVLLRGLPRQRGPLLRLHLTPALLGRAAPRARAGLRARVPAAPPAGGRSGGVLPPRPRGRREVEPRQRRHRALPTRSRDSDLRTPAEALVLATSNT